MTSPVLPAEPVSRSVFATATLSFVGGFVDVVGFIALFGLFTAHVTGNFIMLGVEMVHATQLAIAKILAVPIFIVMVALTRLFVLHYEKKGESPWREMLLAQAALLACFMIAGGLTAPHEDANDLGTVVAGLLGVAAMAVQNAGSRLILQNHGPTTMMTGNTTQAVIDLVDILRGLPEEIPQARKRLKLLVPAILAFTAGALLGALSYVTFSFWCLIVPIVALLAVAVIVAARPAMGA
jgi:uncharacterized membrane protein YoaK (UPF0700 family)